MSREPASKKWYENKTNKDDNQRKIVDEETTSSDMTNAQLQR